MITATPVTIEMLTELKATDSVKRKKELEALIEKRVEEALKLIAKTFSFAGGWWWAWRYYDEDDEAVAFSSARNLCDRSIGYSINGGRNCVIILKDGSEWGLEEEFPLNWLWEDYEAELVEGKAKYRAKEDAKKIDLARRTGELKELKRQHKMTALSKLTPEEIWACGLGRIPRSLSQYKDIEEWRIK